MFKRNFKVLLLIVIPLAIDANIEASTFVFQRRERSLKDLSKLNHAKIIKNDIHEHINIMNGILKHLNDWAFQEIGDTTENDEFNEENYNKLNGKVINLRNNFTELSTEIALMSNDNDITDIKKRSKDLINDLDDLNREFDNKTREGLHLLNDYQSSDDIVNIYETLSTEILLVNKQIIEKEQQIVVKRSIDAIRQKNYASAGQNLNLINCDHRILKIVEEVYSNNANNFYLLINLNEVITNTTKNWIILNELNNQVHNHRDITMNKIVSLTNSLKTKVINKLNDDSDMKKEAVNLLLNLKSDLISIGTMHLTDIIELDNGNLQNSNLNFLWKLFVLDDDLVLEILHQVYIDISEISDVMFTFHKLLGKLITDNIADTKNIFQFPHLIRKFILKIDRKDYLDRYLAIFKSENVPWLIRNILFSKRVCIHKFALVGYLRIQGNDFGGDSEFKPYTYSNSEYLPQEIWKLIHVQGNQYYFENYALPYSYLAVDNNDVKLHGYQALMEPFQSNSSLWMIEPTADYCYIKNVINNKFLYTSERTEYFAYANDIDEDIGENYEWFIRDCTDIL